MGFRKMEFFSDSTDAIRLILEDNITYHQYASTVMNIRDLIAKDWIINLKHILRENNNSADYLAKKGAHQYEALILLDIPRIEMNLMLFADASGVQFLRE
ncbi:Ribonuclease H-like superfamily [Sesbania bispinosa]|nr:Ribonuclease H-like superfamily [Sesbania bispinosa]